MTGRRRINRNLGHGSPAWLGPRLADLRIRNELATRLLRMALADPAAGEHGLRRYIRCAIGHLEGPEDSPW